MGPQDPWSPAWRPDDTGRRLQTIRLARRGAALAGLLFVPVAVAAVVAAGVRTDLALIGVIVGSAGVALLGAGLAPAAVGSRVDAAVVAIAMAIAAPVAAVVPMLIAAFIVGMLVGPGGSAAGSVLSGSVLTAVRIAPLVAVASVIWVVGVRRLAARDRRER